MNSDRHTARMCYVAVTAPTGFTLGIARKGERGYYRTNYPTVPTYQEAGDWAASCNADLGLTANEASEIVASTLG